MKNSFSHTGLSRRDLYGFLWGGVGGWDTTSIFPSGQTDKIINGLEQTLWDRTGTLFLHMPLFGILIISVFLFWEASRHSVICLGMVRHFFSIILFLSPLPGGPLVCLCTFDYTYLTHTRRGLYIYMHVDMHTHTQSLMMLPLISHYNNACHSCHSSSPVGHYVLHSTVSYSSIHPYSFFCLSYYQLFSGIFLSLPISFGTLVVVVVALWYSVLPSFLCSSFWKDCSGVCG